MNQQGFTVVEMIIVIIVGALFATTAFQLFSTINVVAVDTSRRALASNIAYNNMRSYANGQKPLWFDCIGDESGENTPPFSDGTRSGATGQVLLNRTSTDGIKNLPGPTVENVIAIAPYGCGETGAGLPIRVQSKVIYGSPGKERTTTHATYVSY